MKLYKSRLFRIAIAAFLGLFGSGYLGSSIYLGNLFITSPSRKPGPYTPADYGLHYEEVTFHSAASDKLNLRGWWIPKGNSKRVLLLVHVKNGDRSFPLGLSKPLWDRGYNLLIFDLRGHGQSDGEHYSYGQYEQFDIVGAVDFVKGKGFQPGGIGIIGWSMGAASSIMAMGQTTDIRAGVSDSSYGDLTRVAGQRLGMLLFFYPGMVAADRLLYNIDIDQVKPEAVLKKLGNRHLFLIHGDADVTVPVSEVFHLKEAGGSNIADTWILPGVGHAGAYNANEAEYLHRVTNFFDKELI